MERAKPLCEVCSGVLEKGDNFRYIVKPYGSLEGLADSPVQDSLVSSVNFVDFDRIGSSGEPGPDNQNLSSTPDERSDDEEACKEPESIADGGLDDGNRDNENARDDDDPTTFIRAAKYGHHLNFTSLEASITEQCQVCCLFWRLLPEQDRERARHQDQVRSLALAPLDEQRFLTYAYLSSDEVNKYEFQLCLAKQHPVLPLGQRNLFILYPSKETEQHASPKHAEITSAGTSTCSQSTISEESLRLARKWLQECDDHDTCKVGGGIWYPTRLLDLGESSNSVRLVHSHEDPIAGSYTTLSHRWGGATFLKLVRSNLEDLCRAIDIAMLPKTFQDAIHVSKALGARYLWIDSLCIMQDLDDRSDWEHEGSLMGKVYTHSYCNLSASDASDSTEGLARDRSPDFLDVVNINLRTDLLNGNKDLQSYVIEDYYLFDRAVSSCELNHRGWVLQERLLSPRVLHFGYDQLLWECRSTIACEKYPRDVPAITRSIKGTDLKANVAYIRNDEQSWLEFWSTIVRQYSECSLTFGTDKLVALSGIAKQVRAALKDTYVAGMWRKRLELQLFWSRSLVLDWSGTEHSMSRPSSYRAPSWSWTSIDGKIALHPADPSGSLQLSIRVEDVHLGYVSSDDTGSIAGGWVDLSGALKLVRLVLNASEDFDERWSVAFSERHSPGEYCAVALDESLTDDHVLLEHSEQGRLFCMAAFDQAWDESDSDYDEDTEFSP